MGSAYHFDPPIHRAELLREGWHEHRCEPPEQAKPDAVWRCFCGRRWTCIDHMTRSLTRITLTAHWVRRYWPWPR